MKVKNGTAFAYYTNLIKESIKWNGFFISSVISSIRDALENVLNLVYAFFGDCIKQVLAAY